MKKLEILIGKQIYEPGDNVEGKAILRIDKPTKIRNIRLQVIGLEKTSVTVSHGKYSTTYYGKNYIINLKRNLENKNELQPGEHQYPINFQIPKNALPTYSGINAEVFYIIKVRADVPLWFDVKTQKRFRVLYNIDTISQLEKSIATTSKHFPKLLEGARISSGFFSDDKPRPGFLIELDKNTFLAGETIIGRITINNPTQKKLRKVDVLLRAKEFANAQGHRRHVTADKHKAKIDINELIEGIPSKFEIKIPKKVRTSYCGFISRCNWFLEFNLDIALAFDEKATLSINIYQM